MSSLSIDLLDLALSSSLFSSFPFLSLLFRTCKRETERKSEGEQEREAGRSRVNVARKKMGGGYEAEGRGILAKERDEEKRVKYDAESTLRRAGGPRATVRARPKCGSRRGRTVDIEFIGCRVATVHALSLSTHPHSVLPGQRARRFARDLGYSICYAPRAMTHRMALGVRRIERLRLPIPSHVHQEGVDRFA